MTKALYPTFDIHNLDANKLSDEILNVDRFGDYLSKNPHLKVPHKHSFYHLLYFTKGSGSHTVDFESFPVKEGMIYFMRPGQVHNWNFKGAVDGYIINFSPLFFNRYGMSDGVPGQFSFFVGNATNQVKNLNAETRAVVEGLFERILLEKAAQQQQGPLMIAALMIELFIAVQRSAEAEKVATVQPNYNNVILRDFQLLVEQHFRELKLPKDYAALLFIRPARLNAICKEWTDQSAGEVIRNRILLEAKRLLVNFELSISYIALELNFPDASYFVKFFKKYVGSTPDVFRKNQLAGAAV
jgi:AraC family transcriptional activator of pobA